MALIFQTVCAHLQNTVPCQIGTLARLQIWHLFSKESEVLLARSSTRIYRVGMWALSKKCEDCSTAWALLTRVFRVGTSVRSGTWVTCLKVQTLSLKIWETGIPRVLHVWTVYSILRMRIRKLQTGTFRGSRIWRVFLATRILSTRISVLGMSRL